MTPEGKVQNDVKRYLKQNRIYHWRFQAQSNLNGIPDILCLYRGFFIGLELKREKGGHTTDLQLRKLKNINDNGGIGVLIRSVEDVDKIIKSIDNGEYNER